ncbi:MAG TPA: ADOP family duplicated permease, partial [Gemmatimonadaceae bacterium]|nr:ADOP family duplicated permease [Gemmatimonadaceae bacterium]
MPNLKLAFRTLIKSPFVTLVAILSLALGIGANAAIFSLFNQLLLRPLPVASPDRLVNLSAPGPKPGSTSCNQAGDCEEVFSYPMLRDLENADNLPFTGIAGHRAFGANVAFDDQTFSGEGMLVSGSYFPVLGLTPALGRLFTPADDRNVGANYVAVLSYDYWQSRLGSRKSVVGEPIVINGQTMTIIGVAPRDFSGTTLGSRPQVFVPLTMRGLMEPYYQNAGFENRRAYWLYAFARLKPGVSLKQASSAINAIYHPIINDVEVPLQQGMSDQSLKRFRTKDLVLTDGRRGQSSVHSDSRVPLILLFGITSIVLLIACANIANLLLARGAGRSLEMAVRLSLGASRRQLITQLLTESVLLAVIGGVVGIVVAYWTLALVTSLLPNDTATSLDVHLQSSAVVFTALLSLGTGIIFGLFPALNSTRPDLASAIRDGTGKHSGTRAAARFRSSLVTAQIALSMALLICAGLFVKSLRNVSEVDLGLRVNDLITFSVSPALNGYDNTRSRAFFERVHEELSALPGVAGVTEALIPVLSGSNWGTDVSVQGFKKGPDTDANSRFNEVGAGYFGVLGVQLLSGREFTRADEAGRARVAVVNEAFAKKFGLGRDAVGKLMGDRGNDSLDIQIVGLVRDAKYSEVKDEVPPQFFAPVRQDTTTGFLTFYVRSARAGGSEQLLRAIP